MTPGISLMCNIWYIIKGYLWLPCGMLFCILILEPACLFVILRFIRLDVLMNGNLGRVLSGCRPHSLCTGKIQLQRFTISTLPRTSGASQYMCKMTSSLVHVVILDNRGPLKYFILWQFLFFLYYLFFFKI